MLNQEIILTPEECQYIIDSNTGFKRSTLVAYGHSIQASQYRTSQDSYIDTTDEINNLLLPKLLKYNISNLPKVGTLLKYEVGQEFRLHRDSGRAPGNNIKARYKTLSIQLCDTYTGGDFVVWEDKNTQTICDKNIGNMILFPATWLHQAKPVLEGTRYSLVYFLTTANFNNINKSII